MKNAVRSLLFIRHGRTDWNDSRRIQGQRDVDLNACGRAELAACQLPAEWHDAIWYSSPLQRAVHSAQLLGAQRVRCDALLTEMHWGQWEGRTLASLREEFGERMRDNEARGLDFRPAGGESPRDVCQRLQNWLASLPATQERYVVVTHKGLIRAALALATGWSMTQAFDSRVDWSCGHEFALDDRDGFVLTRLNVPLLERVS